MFDWPSLVPDLPSAGNGHPPQIAKCGDAADSVSE